MEFKHLSDFTRDTWDAYSGAESPAGGAEPKIGHLDIIGWPEPGYGCDIVVDAEGIEIVGCEWAIFIPTKSYISYSAFQMGCILAEYLCGRDNITYAELLENGWRSLT